MNNSFSLSRLILLQQFIHISIYSFSQNTGQASGIMNLSRSNETIKIDGALEEPIWQKALYSDKFYDKEDSIHFYSNTKAYLTYDAENFYVGFSCTVKDTSKLPKVPYYKDDEAVKGNEWVGFCVDSYNDGLGAFAFITDAAGNQLTGALTIGNNLTYSFSTKWVSSVKKNKNGYTVEMKIPFVKLPVQWKKDSIVMAVRLVRFDKENGREVQSPFLNTGIENRIIQFQKIKLKGIPPTRPDNLSGTNIQDRMAFKLERAKHFETNTTDERGHAWGDASVIDYSLFKKRDIHGLEKTQGFQYSLHTNSIGEAFKRTSYLKPYNVTNFETFLERTQTTAFVVISNDTIIYEKYFNGFDQNSIFTSFSVAKSFLSTLIGIAIADGYIKSDTDRIVTYLPELLQKDRRFGNISIKDLLSMSSGLHYSDDGDMNDDEITYDDPDLRKAAIQYTKIEEPAGQHFLYDNYRPLLLGMILERVTHMSVSKYMEERLWKPMGGGNASWSLDEHGFEKMESGINCGIYDYARFGELFLHDGNYNGVNIAPEKWIPKATQPQPKPEGWESYFQQTNGYYGYFWWGKLRGNKPTGNDFFALGNKGEYIYICPEKRLIIIRLGFEFGLPSNGSSS